MELNENDLDNEEMDLERFISEKRATALAKVTNLKEAFERFDLNHDDRIDRREQVLMYRTIEREMEAELKSMTKDGHYEEARALQRKLSSLKQDFAALQTQDCSRTHERQRRLLKTANQKAWESLSQTHRSQDDEVARYCEEKAEQLSHFHEVQRTQLEIELAHLPVPAMKYSKRCLELMNSELNLSRLKQYEEAKAVRRVIDRLKPKEEAAFYRKFEEKKQTRRDLLLRKQEEEQKRLREKLEETNFFHDFRKKVDSSRHSRKLGNLHRDMSHAHALEIQRKPELSVKPSHHWQTRKNYATTSSSLRGQHLLDHVKGKKSGEKIYVASLTSIHDFNSRPLSGTTNL